MPPAMRGKTVKIFQAMGASLARDGIVDSAVIESAKKPYRLGTATRALYRLVMPTGILNAYWDANLKRNGAYERRFDAPYGAPYEG